MRNSIAAAAILAGSAATGACGQIAQGAAARRFRATTRSATSSRSRSPAPMRSRCRPAAIRRFRAQGPQKLLDRTVVVVQGDKLVIDPQEHHGWFNFSWNSHGKTHFTVTVPQLSAATMAGSGDIQVDHVQGDRSTARSPARAGSGRYGECRSAEARDRRFRNREGRRRQGADRRLLRSAARVISKRERSRPCRRRSRSPALEASRPMRPALPTSASWARATSTLRAAPNVR